MTARQEQALNQILELTALLSLDMEREFSKLGLTPSRTHLLWELQQRGTATQRELAQALKVSPRNVTGLVDGLVATGFVTREAHPDDRRAILVSFTKHGAKTMAAMANEHTQLAKLLFEGMKDFPAFVRGMDHVLARLKEAMA